MAGALLQPWHTLAQFLFTAVSPSGTRRVPDNVPLVTAPAALHGRQFDVLVIGVKPQAIADALPAYLPFLAPGGLLISLAAGFRCASLRHHAPDASIVRIMPNLPVELGCGVSGVYVDGAIGDRERQLVDTLMAPTGQVIWAESEDQLDRITAVAGSGPGFAFELLRCWCNAAEDLGFSTAQARDMVLGTLGGAVSLARASSDSPEQLRNAVTSKNGTTQTGLQALNGDGLLDEAFMRTVRATYARALELR
jgi:pyrroline-5-carboxylate reductase